ELEIVVAAHFRIPAEIHEIRRQAPALESAGAQREQARRAEPLVVARVDVRGLTRETAANWRRVFIRHAHGVAGERSELAEHRGLLDEIDTQRKVGARSEQRPSELVELVLLRVVLQGGIVERLAILQHSAEHFDAPIAVEWPDA